MLFITTCLPMQWMAFWLQGKKWEITVCFWPRALLKGPKRSFVVLLVVALLLGVESGSKNVTNGTKSVSEQILFQNCSLVGPRATYFGLVWTLMVLYDLIWHFMVLYCLFINKISNYNISFKKHLDSFRNLIKKIYWRISVSMSMAYFE